MWRIKLHRCGKNSGFEFQQYSRLYTKTLPLDQTEMLGNITQTLKKCTAKLI